MIEMKSINISMMMLHCEAIICLIYIDDFLYYLSIYYIIGMQYIRIFVYICK